MTAEGTHKPSCYNCNLSPYCVAKYMMDELIAKTAAFDKEISGRYTTCSRKTELYECLATNCNKFNEYKTQ